MKKIKNILILAGGDGDRFWPLENKVLFNFLNTPLIIDIVKRLLKYGDKIYLVTHQNNFSIIKRLIENYSLSPYVNLSFQASDIPGQAGAVDTVKKIIKGEVLIVNASDKIDFSILKYLNERRNKVVFFGRKTTQYFPGGYFKFDKNNQLEAVIEKPKKDKIPSNFIKLVLDYYFDFQIIIKNILSINSKDDDVYEQAINKILADKSIERSYFVYDRDMISLKYSWNLLTMMMSYLEEIDKPYISKTAKISDRSKIVGNVFIDDGAVIGDYVKIVGPAYIGENSVVADYNLIRESHIGKDCLIGSYSEIARSYIGNKVFLHRNYVGDSVLADGTMMGGGSNIANLRFDGGSVRSKIKGKKIDTQLHKLGLVAGKNVKIGVNAMIYPGVKIGKDSWVAPNETVKDDLEERIYYINNRKKKNIKV